MFKRFYPDEYGRSTYTLKYEEYYKKGIRGLIFDIDNTLVPHDAPADRQALKLFKRLERIGFQSCFLSNNGEARVQSFNEKIGIHYIYKANKPKKGAYLRAMELMGTDATNTLAVGDQLFTDVWGANRVGIHCVLVKPIHPKEKWSIVLKRYLEKPILYFYHRQRQKTIPVKRK